MYLATIDCGTSTTRVYVIDETGQVYGRSATAVGVRNTAIEGSNLTLRTAISDCFLNACAEAELEPGQLTLAIAAGMITSELGITAVPHRSAPADKRELARNLHVMHDSTLLPVAIPIYLIPGIKNYQREGDAGISSVGSLDFMRGEEVQVFGLLESQDTSPPYVITVLSSHTKFIAVDSDLNITGSITTISGQMYRALKNETFIGKSIQEPAEPKPFSWWHPEIVDMACDALEKGGFLRSLMMGRFMDVLLDTSWYERKLFVESLIAFEDMKALNQLYALGCSNDSQLFLVGDPQRCEIYAYVLKEWSGWTGAIHHITDEARIDALNITGSLAIARAAGILEG
ncbi:MAG: 2-dehydro-3-deoxygalactonokinase [Spirochaetia bacterium]|nr:2-dehydro-3-deoxygalactonokinase [Spirochaetia bacterium]MCF7940598.1 2-dehydro-3-deoxygalactonokinase [Spirochaetia bacterium]